MSLRKPKSNMEETDSSRVYKRARKYYLDGIGEVGCVLCPYHRKENAHKYQRSWKKSRKTQRKIKLGV